MELNYIDLFIGGLLIYGLVKGLLKGFLVEIASLLALVLGIYGAIEFSDIVGAFLSDKFNWDSASISLIAFGITFFGIMIVVSMIGKALTSVASVIALGWLNKLLGAVFGTIKMAFIVSVILSVFVQVNETFNFIEEKTLKESILFEQISTLSNNTLPMLKDHNMKEWWDDTTDKVMDNTINKVMNEKSE
ncbi:MAG: CvpA family protein [Ichthyobacteriaceae bacterium]|nr:CvpA family protein [Ichthyobacteriaceae bacterium]